MRRLVVNSGGIDSAVTLAMAVAQGVELHSLYVDLGSRQGAREAKCAKAQAAARGAKHTVAMLRCPWLNKHWLFDPDVFIVSEKSDKAGTVGPRKFVVPMRNLMILSVAASHAATIGAEELWLGFDYRGADKAATSPSWDKRPEFVKAFWAVVAECDEWASGLRIVTPLQGNDKATTIRLGKKWHVDFAATWSCYNSLPKHCGKCSACISRSDGFTSLEMVDPAGYASERMLNNHVEWEKK